VTRPAEIEGIRLPIPQPELQIVTFEGDNVRTAQISAGMLEYGWMHLSTLDPPPVMFVVNPSAGSVLNQDLEDLAAAVARARRGEFEEAAFERTY
jgi:hypothetical protein